MNQSAFALALTFGLLAASGAQAQLLDGATGVRVDAGTGISADVSPLLDATTTVNVTTQAEQASTTSGSANAALGFSFDRKDLDEGTQYSIEDASAVQTVAGLESYAASSVRDDDRLESATLSDGSLTVVYRTDAKFLGLIPASIRVTATTDADGNVTVRYPWYAFLMPTYESRADLEARLTKEQASIRDEVSAGMVGGEARQWALMLERLRSSLYVTASAEARR